MLAADQFGKEETTMTENVITTCSAGRGTTASLAGTGVPAPPPAAAHTAIVEHLLPVDLLPAPVADGLARLWKSAQLRRALGYAGPLLPMLAEAVGIGGTGQVLLTVMLRLAERALDDSHESSEQSD